jgi:hypothetical protein
MADEIRIQGTLGEEIIAADDIGGKKFERVKLTAGPDGSANDLWSDNAGTDGDAASRVGLYTNERGYVYNAADGTWSRRRAPTADAVGGNYLDSSGQMVYNGSTWDRAYSAVARDGSSAIAGVPGVAMLGRDNSGFWRIPRMAQGDGQTPVEMLAAANMLYNPTTLTFDRERGNEYRQILASAARTASTASPLQTNYNHRGVYVYVRVTAGTGYSITPAIFLQDEQTGEWYDQYLSTTFTGPPPQHIRLLVYPGITTSPTLAFSSVVPRTWGVYITHGNANSVTYSVSAWMLL